MVLFLLLFVCLLICVWQVLIIFEYIYIYYKSMKAFLSFLWNEVNPYKWDGTFNASHLILNLILLNLYGFVRIYIYICIYIYTYINCICFHGCTIALNTKETDLCQWRRKKSQNDCQIHPNPTQYVRFSWNWILKFCDWIFFTKMLRIPTRLTSDPPASHVTLSSLTLTPPHNPLPHRVHYLLFPFPPILPTSQSLPAFCSVPAKACVSLGTFIYVCVCVCVCHLQTGVKD